LSTSALDPAPVRSSEQFLSSSCNDGMSAQVSDQPVWRGG
jgi:hypothetical protein